MKKNRLTKICKNCNKEFEITFCRRNEAKFCSRNCYNEAMKKNLTSHKGRTYVKFTCLNCSREFKVIKRRYGTKSQKTRKFCNRKCYFSYVKNQSSRSKVDENIRRRESLAANCNICGYDRFIEITHIVPASLGGTFEKENILFLCPNHHRLYDSDLLTKNEEERIKFKVISAFKKFDLTKLKIVRFKKLVDHWQKVLTLHT